ncbi:MAG: pantetheine-phosphate adenylyltransferase [Desulfovibrio sp.]|nr:pantetheine-phosphate adenylyltransferase [Desulfovibrio sp.]
MPEPRAHTVVYPGTVDPVTNGHVSIIRRALRFFDKVVVAVAENAGKNPLFSLEERVAFVKDATAHLKRVEVIPYGGLTVQFAAAHGACAMLRGLRATGDFEYEFQLALMNRRLQDDMQTVFLMTDYRWLFVSSSIVKAAASHGGDIAGLVPELVRTRLEELYRTGGMNQSTPCLGAPQAGYGRKPSGGS